MLNCCCCIFLAWIVCVVCCLCITCIVLLLDGWCLFVLLFVCNVNCCAVCLCLVWGVICVRVLSWLVGFVFFWYKVVCFCCWMCCFYGLFGVMLCCVSVTVLLILFCLWCVCVYYFLGGVGHCMFIHVYFWFVFVNTWFIVCVCVFSIFS